jgi:comEA protein
MSKYKILIGVIFLVFLGMTAYAAGGMSNPGGSGQTQNPDSSSPGMSSDQSSSVDINSASVDELKKLPGVNDRLAKNIVDYRNSNGPFKSINELKNVKGMSDSKFNKIKDKVVLQSSPSPSPEAPSEPSPSTPDNMSPPSSPGPSTY